MDKPKLDRLLCPVDYSHYAGAGLDYALGMARSLGAELRLLHVTEPALMPACSDYGLAGLGTPIEELEDLARQEMEAMVEQCRAEYDRVSGVVRSGAPFVEIIRYAREWPADLVVISTHGRTGLGHMLIGSVAEKVVRKSPCPVLTVRHADHAQEAP